MTTETSPTIDPIVEHVRIHYAGAARAVLERGESADAASAACCGPTKRGKVTDRPNPG